MENGLIIHQVHIDKNVVYNTIRWKLKVWKPTVDNSLQLIESLDIASTYNMIAISSAVFLDKVPLVVIFLWICKFQFCQSKEIVTVS